MPDVAESPLTCGWKVLLGRLFLFRKTLGLEVPRRASMEESARTPGTTMMGNLRSQRSKPRAELDLKAVLPHRLAAHFAKPRNDI